MYTDLTTMNEHIIAQEAEFEPNNDGARCAGSLAAWAQRFTDVIYFTYLGVPEIALQAADIDVSPPEPFDVDPIEISVTVHNLAPWNATDVILVQVFDGDPGMGGVPLCEVPIAGLPARSDDTVTCTVGPLAAGLHDICARAVAVVDGHPGNNEACTTIEVLATGACCLPGGSCNITTKPTDCFDDGGTWLGPGSGCPPRGCPVTIGSCCLGDNVCVNDLNADECAAMGGLYAGNATSCVDHPPVCCPWDCQADPSGAVDINDLLDLLASWGDEGPCDFDGGAVSITDLLELLANWGACP